MQTVAAHHPKADRYIFLADAAYDFADLEIPATIVPAEDIGIAGFDEMVFRYTVIELNTAIKPSCIRWLFAEREYDQVIYLDPDIFVLRPLTAVKEALDQGASVVLTPHMMEPLQDGYQPDDLTIMKSGVYNLGFVAFSRSETVTSFLEWWATRLFKHCRVDIANNLFTDQRWMDLAPAFLPNTVILRHPGYNVAYWNLLHRPVSKGSKGWTAAGEPLHFVHFSGVNPREPERFSKHQTRFSANSIGGLRPLFDSYVARLLANGYEKYITAPYAYGQFADGRDVHSLMRHYYCRAEENGDSVPGVSLETAGDFFDGVEPALSQSGLPNITRLMHQLWTGREDLQKAFRIDTADGRIAYINWFIETAAREEGFDDLTVSAAAALRGRKEDAPAAAKQPRPLRPAWAPDEPWSGAAHDADIYLKGRAQLLRPGNWPAGLPRQMAILWQGRRDLQQAFPLTNTDSADRYVAWCLTQGVLEGQILPELVDTAFWQELDTPIEMAGVYDDMPMTRGLLMLYGACDDREAVARFPEDSHSRSQIAVWLGVVAAQKYRWPAGMMRRLRDWLHSPVGSPVIGRIALPRLLLMLRDTRIDLQRAFDLTSKSGGIDLLCWFLFAGLDEFGLEREDLPGYLRQGLFATDESGGITLIHHMIRRQRPDVAAEYDIRSDDGRAGYFDWFAKHGHIELARHKLLAPPSAENVIPTGGSRDRSGAPLVVLTGCIAEPSGRGEDVRMTMRALDSHDVPYITLDRTDGTVRDRLGKSIDPAALLGASVNIVHLNADTAYDDHQFLRRHGIGDARLIGYWAWELAKFPAEYFRAFSFYDEIWASTKFAFDSFNIGRRPVMLMPMPVELPDNLPEMDRSYFRLSASRFLFLFTFDFGSFRERKNPDAVIAAFRRAFPDKRDRVGLIIKTINAESHQQQWQRLQRLAQGDERVVMRNGRYTREEVINLMKTCDCYVSLHRSEGFGRGPAEAMLLGLPVIVSNYSGNVDFTNEDNSFLVDCRLVPVGEGEYPGSAGQVWADADVEHAARQMRRAFDEPAEAAEVGLRAKRFMEEHHSPRAIGVGYLERLRELEPKLRPDPTVDQPVAVLSRGVAATRTRPGAAARKPAARRRAQR